MSDCRVIHGDCLEVMRDFAPGSFDAVITSPPYDNLREYGGYSFDFEPTAGQLWRVVKPGGVVVWVVGDATIDGDETGTSFRQALGFKALGFKLLDTMIYRKGGQGATGSNNAYWQDFEYMFVFVKGELATFNPICDRRNVTPPRTRLESQGHRLANGDTKGDRVIERQPFGRRFNVWQFHEAGTRIDHPAVFPLQLAKDHLRSWTNPDARVLDPFCGSGTTGVACAELGRDFCGIEISEEYCQIARQRIEAATRQGRLAL